MSVRFIIAGIAGAVAGYAGSGFTSFNPQAAATTFSLVPALGGALSPKPVHVAGRRRVKRRPGSRR